MNYHRSSDSDRRPEAELAPAIALQDVPSSNPVRARAVWNQADVLSLVTVLAQHWLWIIVSPILAVLATIGYLLLTDPSYEVGAQLMVRFGNELSAPPTISAVSNQQLIPISKRFEDITAEVQIMKDPKIVRRVVEDMGEAFFYGEDEAATLVQKVKKLIRQSITFAKDQFRGVLVRIGILPELSRLDRVIVALQAYLTIEQVTRSDVIELTLLYPDPRLGEEIMRRFIATYLAKRKEIYSDEHISSFFKKELDRIDHSLTNAENSYSKERLKLAAWSVDDQRSFAVQRRENLLRALQDAGSTIEVATARIEEIERQLTSLPEWVPSTQSQRPNATREALELKQFDLKLQIQAESRRTGTRSPQVEGLSEQIKDLDTYLAAQPQRVPGDNVTLFNPLREDLLKERGDARLLVATTQRKLDGLSRDLAGIEGELKLIEEAALTLSRKLRDVERLRLTQQRFQQGSDEARINDEIAAAQISNVIVVAEPQAGVTPSSPRVLRLLLLAIALSILAACCLILLFDALRPKIRSNGDILSLVDSNTIVRAIGERSRSG